MITKQKKCRRAEEKLQTLADTNLELKAELIKLAKSAKQSDNESSDDENIDLDGVRLELQENVQNVDTSIEKSSD